jgi:hypothetical protein
VIGGDGVGVQIIVGAVGIFQAIYNDLLAHRIDESATARGGVEPLFDFSGKVLLVDFGLI